MSAMAFYVLLVVALGLIALLFVAAMVLDSDYSVPEAPDHVLLKPLPRVTKVRTDQYRLSMELENGLEISAPLGWFPQLEGATVEQRRAYEIWPQGDVVSWPAVDEDISVYGVLGMSD